MSMNSQLTEQLGMVKVAGTLKQSTQVQLVQILLHATKLSSAKRHPSLLGRHVHFASQVESGPVQNMSQTGMINWPMSASACLLQKQISHRVRNFAFAR